MCGIAGTVGITDKNALETMLERLAHRGPDDIGTYHDGARNVHLGHRRLSIVDLSPAGHQPMISADGTVSVVFNGEIYNYRTLRADLEKAGCRFRSGSDTEAIVQGYEAYGAEVFNKLDGMWAIALYDTRAGKLFLSRDPAGMKPLYLSRDNGRILFASEIGALASVLTGHALDKSAVARFLAHGYVMGDATFYADIHSLPQGTTLTIDLVKGGEQAVSYTPRQQPAHASLDETVDAFERTFEESVRATLQADVPVGIFLSGGIDSSLVAYHVKKTGARLQAFTIGFGEEAFDESPTAARIAHHLGFPHLVHTLRARDIANDIDAIFDSFGQPFADMSAVPTYYLSRLAHDQGYKVALSGDGADELFGGYPTHYLPTILRWYRHLPRLVDTIAERSVSLMPSGFAALSAREKLTRFLHGARYPAATAHALWKRVFTDDELALLVSDQDLLSCPLDFSQAFALAESTSADDIDRAMKADFFTFLTSDCLVKSDISAMRSALEMRSPFLNKTVIEFAWNLPSAFKASPFATKKLLRRSLERVLPGDITRLPKRGFVPPLAHWLGGELKPVMTDLLSEQALAKTGFVNYRYVTKLMEEHLAGTTDHAKKLWTLMSLARFYAKRPS